MKNVFLTVGAVIGAAGVGYWLGLEVGRKQEEEEEAAAAAAGLFLQNRRRHAASQASAAGNYRWKL